MSRKTMGLVVAAVGVVLIVVSALADVIGVSGNNEFGFRQITGVGVGALVAIFGGLSAFRGAEPK